MTEIIRDKICWIKYVPMIPMIIYFVDMYVSFSSKSFFLTLKALKVFWSNYTHQQSGCLLPGLVASLLKPPEIRSTQNAVGSEFSYITYIFIHIMSSNIIYSQ